jgi:polyhydroxyalkanoate synthesis regulator phasin
MAEPADTNHRSLLDQAERIVLAAIGAVALSRERIDELSDHIADRLGVSRDEARALLGEVASGWRRETARVGERTGEAATRIVRELGLATSEQFEDVELRLAQLEHRVRLLERGPS